MLMRCRCLVRHCCGGQQPNSKVFTKYFSNLSIPLSPKVLAMKSQIESVLDSGCTGDHVMHNMSEKSGITDLSFENRDSKKTGKSKKVSVYFKMDAEGIKAYRKAAAAMSNNPSVELSYTPHFGQSRITFEWEQFWDTVNSQRLGDAVTPRGLLQLGKAKDETDDNNNNNG